MHIPDPMTSFGRFLRISQNNSRRSFISPRFHLAAKMGRRSRTSPFTSRERSPSAGGFVCSLSIPRLSESCASCPLLTQILRRLFVSPSVNDPPFSSISAANSSRIFCRELWTPFSSKCHSTQVRPENRRGRRWIRTHSSTASTHSSLSSPSRTLILTLFVSLCSTTDSLAPPIKLRIAHVRIIWSAVTLASAWRDGGSFPAPSREVLDCHVSGSLVPGSLDSLSVASDLGSSFRLLLELLLNPFATALKVVCRVPNSCSNGTATETSQTSPYRGAFSWV